MFQAVDAKGTKEADAKWQEIRSMIEDKTNPIPSLTMGDILLESNKDWAAHAIQKDPNYESKIRFLIDIEAWKEAVEELFKQSKHKEFDNLLEKVKREHGMKARRADTQEDEDRQ